MQIHSSGFTSVRDTVEFNPARGNADLVVAQHIVGHAVSVGAAVGPRVFQRRGEAAPHDHVECDGGVLCLVEADPDGSQRLDHAVVNGSDIGARRVRRQPPAAANGPLLGRPAHARGAVEDPPVGVLADAEDQLQRVVARMGRGPDLFRPGRIRLAYRRERVHDLVGQRLIFGEQVSVIG